MPAPTSVKERLSVARSSGVMRASSRARSSTAPSWRNEGLEGAWYPLSRDASVRIAIVGTGYVGLVTGACFADLGHEIACVDVDPEKVDKLRAGQIPFHEPGLDEVVARGLESGRLRFTTSLADVMDGAQFAFICVQTPPADDGSATSAASSRSPPTSRSTSSPTSSS